MSKQFTETNEQPSQRRISNASAYSAHIQEAMRYDKLSSSAYYLVMTILSAVSKGYTEERWREEQQRTLEALTNQSPDKGASHTNTVDYYEQAARRLKDLMLWPW
jgi:rhamnogalacturonyl hydrolase YesR